jgi:hypothetical protein
MKPTKAALLLLLPLLIGCSKNPAPLEVTTKKDAGTVEAVAYLPAGFRQQPKTILTTTLGVFVIDGHISIRTDIPTFITNDKYITWEGSPLHYHIK